MAEATGSWLLNNLVCRRQQRFRDGEAERLGGFEVENCLAYCEVKIALGIMPWMPLVPSTTWVT